MGKEEEEETQTLAGGGGRKRGVETVPTLLGDPKKKKKDWKAGERKGGEEEEDGGGGGGWVLQFLPPSFVLLLPRKVIRGLMESSNRSCSVLMQDGYREKCGWKNTQKWRKMEIPPKYSRARYVP